MSINTIYHQPFQGLKATPRPNGPEERIEQLEEEVDSIQLEVDASTAENILALQETVGDAESGLVKDVSDLQGIVGTYEGEGTLAGDISDLAGDVSDLQGTVGTYEGEGTLVGDISDLAGDVSDLQGIVGTYEGEGTLAGDISDLAGDVYEGEGTLAGDIADILGSPSTISHDNLSDLSGHVSSDESALLDKMSWDTNASTISVTLNDNVTMQTGQESFVRVVAGENLVNGNVVYFTGSSGEYPIAMKAQADTAVHARVKGIATESILKDAQGFICNFGVIHDMNMDGTTAGDLLYLSPTTPGAFTKTLPLPPYAQVVVGRVVIVNATTGSIYRSSSPNYPISSDEIAVNRLSTSTKTTLQDLVNTWGVGMLSGGVISNEGSQQIKVTAGTGIIAIINSDDAPAAFVDWGEKVATTITDARVTWVAVEYNSGSPRVVLIEGSSPTDYSVPAAINYQDCFPLGYATRNGTDLWVTNNPRRMQDVLGGLNSRFYQTMPLARDERVGGIILGETGTRNITLSGGVLWDRANQFSISAINTSTGGTFSTWYRATPSGWVHTKNVTQWPNDKYDNGSGTLQTVISTPLRYANLWWYICTEGCLHCVYGQVLYTTASAASLASPPASLPLPISTHGRLIAGTTFAGSGATFTAIDSSFTSIFTATASTSHNNLSGLQGGTTAEYYHLTSAQSTLLTTGVIPTDPVEITSMPEGNAYTIPDGCPRSYFHWSNGSAASTNLNLTLPTGAGNSGKAHFVIVDLTGSTPDTITIVNSGDNANGVTTGNIYLCFGAAYWLLVGGE